MKNKDIQDYASYFLLRMKQIHHLGKDNRVQNLSNPHRNFVYNLEDKFCI